MTSSGIEHPTFRLVFLFYYQWSGTFGTAATTGLLYQPEMIGDGGEELVE
jgi:hypothetical protein